MGKAVRDKLLRCLIQQVITRSVLRTKNLPFASGEASPPLIISEQEGERPSGLHAKDDIRTLGRVFVKDKESRRESLVRSSRMPIERCLPTWLDGEVDHPKRVPFIFIFTEFKRLNKVDTNSIGIANGVYVRYTRC